MRHLALVAVLVVASTSLAQGWQKKASDFREQLTAERKKLGLDKPGQRFPTPEVKFVGAALDDGLLGVVCPGGSLKVTLDGVPPKSLVVSSTDEVDVKEGAWAGTKWTGTLTAKPHATPRTFSLVAVVAPSGREAWSSTYLLGCKRTLVVTVDDATLTLPLDVRSLRQVVNGEWKKGGKSLGSRQHEVRVSEGSVSVRAVQDENDLLRAQLAMAQALESPKSKALEARFTAAMKKLDACGKNQATMMACMQGLQPELDAITREREVLNREAQRTMAPPFGCLALELDATQPEGTGCAGHGNDERVPAKVSWQ